MISFFKFLRLISFALVLMLSLTSAYNPIIESKNFLFEVLPNNQLKVIGLPNKKHVHIPEFISHKGIHYRVTALGKCCTVLSHKIKEIQLPPSLITIEDNVFTFMPFIEEIIIPNSVTYIGEKIAEGCPNLRKIVFPDHATKKNGAFEFNNCDKLETICGHNIKLPSYLHNTLLSMPFNIPYKKQNKQFISCLEKEKELTKQREKEEIAKNAKEISRETISGKEGLKYQIVEYSHGFSSVENLSGEEIIPRIAKKVKYSDNRFLIKGESYYALYDVYGNCIIPFDRHYIDLGFKTILGSSSSGQAITFIAINPSGGENMSIGICDLETGDEIIPAYKYDFVCPAMNANIKYCLVKRNDKYGLCSWDGIETVNCEFEDFAIKKTCLHMIKDSRRGAYIKIPYENLSGGGYLPLPLYETVIAQSSSELRSEGKSSLYAVNTSNYSTTDLYSISSSTPHKKEETIDGMNDMFNNIMGLYNNLMEKLNGAYVTAVPDKNDRFWLMLGVSGNIRPKDITVRLTRNGNHSSTLLSSFPTQFAFTITAPNYLPGDKIELIYNGSIYRTEAIPTKDSKEYDAFCVSRIKAITIIAQNMMRNSHSSYNSTAQKGQHQESCSFCHGTGFSPVKKSVASYESRYSDHKCEICGDWTYHYHERCPSCGGHKAISKTGF